jgi:serine/threonine protein kinase
MAEVRGSVPVQQRVIMQMPEALVFLHGRDLAHMDIKPENVLFADRSLAVCKLCGFGHGWRDNRSVLVTHCGWPG